MFPQKKFKSEANRSTAPSKSLGRDKQRKSNLKSVNSLAASVGSVKNVERIIPAYDDCGKRHFWECHSKLGAYFRCGSTDHFLRD